MNNQGIILGRTLKQVENEVIPMLVLYNPNDGTILEITEDIKLVDMRLNDRGQVIFANGLTASGYLWDPIQGMTHLGDFFMPVCFNNKDQVVGIQSDGAEIRNVKWVMWTPNEGQVQMKLDDLESSSDEIFIIKTDESESFNKVIYINAINDNGYMIAQQLCSDKSRKCIVLIPK